MNALMGKANAVLLKQQECNRSLLRVLGLARTQGYYHYRYLLQSFNNL